MYKTEPHLHVSEVSPCARLSAREAIRLYAEAGYHTVFVSDHLKKVFYDKHEGISWAEKTDRFLMGYELAKEVGREYGVTVLLSAELQLCESSKHYLLYGFDRDFLNARQDLFDMSIAEFYAYAKENGVTVIQAHPYRDGAKGPAFPYIDAVEAYNSNPRHENHSECGFAFAKEKGIPVTAGSDTHRDEDVALTGVLTDTPIESAEDYVRLVMSGSARIIGWEENT